MSHHPDSENDALTDHDDTGGDRDRRAVPAVAWGFIAGTVVTGFVVATAVAVVLAMQWSRTSNDLDEAKAALEITNRDLDAVTREIELLSADLETAETAQADADEQAQAAEKRATEAESRANAADTETTATVPVCDRAAPDLCIEITDVAITGDGQGLVITWDAFGFTPDISGFHAHFYWDIFSAEQVGTNAPGQQGPWDAIADQPYDSTGRVVALANRPQGATAVCATPVNDSHGVVDPAIFHCFDVPA